MHRIQRLAEVEEHVQIAHGALGGAQCVELRSLQVNCVLLSQYQRGSAGSWCGIELQRRVAVGSLVGQTLKYQSRLADPDLVAVRKQSLLDRDIIHEGTITAVKILDQESLVFPPNHAVLARYQRVKKRNLIARFTANRHRIFRKRKRSAIER